MIEPAHIQGQLVTRDANLAIVVARFNDLITRHLLWGAEQTWQRLGGEPGALTVSWVPGSFELPVTAKALAASGRYHAVICLGCVIRGETDHYDHVVNQAAKGIREVGTQTGVPCIFGVITCDTVEQAINRAGVKQGNQGEKALMAGLEMAQLIRQLGGKREG